jgi:polyhydroxybutyrate depolymerase
MLPLVRRGGTTKPQLSFMVAGVARTAIVRIPSPYAPDRAYPLIVLFHGYGNQGDEVDSQFGVYAPARANAIIVSPDALDRAGTGRPGWESRDVPVLDEIAAWAKANLCVDTGRVFIAGVSNGGVMVNTMACARGDSLRGLAVVAAGLPTMTNCQRSVAMVGVHSPMDTQVSYASGLRSRDYWKRRNGCGDKMLMPAPCDSYPGCQPDLPVAWCEHNEGVYMSGGAWTYHGWARAANEAVWSFFSKL